MNSYIDNQKQVFTLIDCLASINNKEDKAEQAKKIVEDKWDQFHSDFENTSRKKRYSTGKVEKGLFNHVANVCDWKTNSDYMKKASRIMILCGYHSYEKKKNRFRQKIQNILKKDKSKSPKMESKKRKRISKKNEIEYDVSDSIFQVNNDLPSSNNQGKNNISSINQDVYDVPFPFDQETNKQQPTMNQKELLLIHFIHHNNPTNKECIPSDEDSVNNSFNSLSDNPLLRQSVDTDYGNNNNLIIQEDNSSWGRTISGYDDLSDLPNPANQQNQYYQFYQ